jgi:hypothetical protein
VIDQQHDAVFGCRFVVTDAGRRPGIGERNFIGQGDVGDRTYDIGGRFSVMIHLLFC